MQKIDKGGLRQNREGGTHPPLPDNRTQQKHQSIYHQIFEKKSFINLPV